MAIRAETYSWYLCNKQHISNHQIVVFDSRLIQLYWVPTWHICLRPDMDNWFTTINQRNAQTNSLNIYVTISHLTFPHVLCLVDSASRYNCVKKNQLDAQLILSIFRQPLHVSCVSTPIIKRYNRMYTKLVFIILFRWLSVDLVGFQSTRNRRMDGS